MNWQLALFVAVYLAVGAVFVYHLFRDPGDDL